MSTSQLHTIQKKCTVTGELFEIDPWQQEHIQRVSPEYNGTVYDIPLPTLCPDERFRRRLAHHNERHLYHRTCDKTGKGIISIYSPDKDLVVYDVEEWWKDDWDPLEYGQDIDFSRSFFEQLSDIRSVVPRMSVTQENTENSVFTSCVSDLKNCYLLFTSDHSQDCGYGTWTQNCRDSYDNCMVDACELAYECIFSDQIYKSVYCIQSVQCKDSAFLFDCHNCTNCFLCHGLRNKEYHIGNIGYTKDEYFQKLKEFPISSHSNLETVKGHFMDMIRKANHLYIWRKGTIIHSSGDLLTDTENCTNCYEVTRSKDCQYSLGYEMKDAMDCTYGNAELGYENCECFPMAFKSAFNVNSYTGSNLYYCDLCMNNCSNCFGCVGLKHKEYCILNKQYTKEEYEQLVPKLIAHMESQSEWGEAIPIEHSNFAYNESLAMDYFPLTKEEVMQKGYKWLEKDDREYQPATCSIPDDIEEVPDSIIDEVLACTSCQKNYRIIIQELQFYRLMGLPIPRKCFDCRYAQRRELKNPRHLFQRSCDQCKKEIESVYADDRPENVLCESCYLEEVY